MYDTQWQESSIFSRLGDQRFIASSFVIAPSSCTLSAIIPHRNFTIFLTYTSSLSLAFLQWNVVGNFSSTVLNLCKLLCWANKIKAKKREWRRVEWQKKEKNVLKFSNVRCSLSLWCWDVINRATGQEWGGRGMNGELADETVSPKMTLTGAPH